MRLATFVSTVFAGLFMPDNENFLQEMNDKFNWE
jgi:gamma-glutamyl hydrolase